MFQRNLHCAVLASAIAILTAFSGCMTTPGNGTTLASRSDSVFFGGFVEAPYERVTVSALNPKTKLWEVIGTCVSDESPVTYGGYLWHGWNVRCTIPARCWIRVPGAVLAHATIKATGINGDLATFEKGLGDTYDFQDYSSPIDIYASHGAGTSATLYSK